uniref:Ig-like domain-containing protein n=1 Tax=Dicentrarchus labrax TaxID=13489 RepID=A0A8P4KAY3_DICLA
MSVFFILMKSRMLQHSVLPFCLTVVVLLLVQSCEGSLSAKSRLIADKGIVALAGDDVILSCSLVPANSASSQTVVWTRPDLDPKYIHVQKDGQPVCSSQNLLYFNRTALFEEELKHGNVSLKLSRVKISDGGKYFCFVQSVVWAVSIKLTVGKSAVSCF